MYILWFETANICLPLKINRTQLILLAKIVNFGYLKARSLCLGALLVPTVVTYPQLLVSLCNHLLLTPLFPQQGIFGFLSPPDL
jgi:hypothetical protein